MEPNSKFGNTSSSLAMATYIAIKHNIKVLLISTSLNDTTIKDGLWPEQKNKGFGLFSSNHSHGVEKNGIEGLDRVIRSNKMSPDIITDYASIVLKNRLEIIQGLEGTVEQYGLVKDKYPQIISSANKYYDMVIVDLDNRVGQQTTVDILTGSDVIIGMTSQRAKDIKKIQEIIKEKKILKQSNTILTIGRYMEDTKYNIKNITRSLLHQKDMVNVILYNKLYFEALQEGKVIDLFINIMDVKEKDTNYSFIYEINRLYETINVKLQMQRMEN